MKEYMERIRDRVYGLDVHHGKITPKQGHDQVFYYIVEHTNDAEFIKSEALKMITSFGQTSYCFFGKYEPMWHVAFDEADISVFGIDDDVAMTMEYHNLEEMAESIDLELHVRTSKPCDTYIVYDDKELYKQLKMYLEVEI